MHLRTLLLILAVTTIVITQQQLWNPWEGLKLFPAMPAPHPHYINYYKSQGYETDDKGNVWHGNDHAKLMIFARSSYP
ncbi:hypothetical protein Q1695_010863 [Nippostrongylus brasiliensis]|nr:hypothetical protein Q1695_010863 [Nippostrongylus brasiliensis]